MIKRERYMQRIRPFMDNELIKVLTGIRRCGKSVMLDLIREELKDRGVREEQCISFNFESMMNARFCNAPALYEELARRISAVKGRSYLFFDEIQEVDGWEKCINSARVDFDCDIYITGSNAKLLSGELASCLGGRYIEIVIYPFSFEEYLAAADQGTDTPDVGAVFSRYLETGGMPFLTKLHRDREASLQYLRDVYRSVLFKDVVQRSSIRDIDLLERIITYMLAEIGHPFTANSISKYLKSEKRNAAPETVLNYINACCAAFLFFRTRREDIAGKQILTVSEKYYLADHGFREAVYGGNTGSIDQVLENIVYMELLRRGWNVTVGKNGEKEIDFIARRGAEKIYVQVTYLLANAQTADREFGAFDAVRDNYPKYVLSMDGFNMSRDGIRHMNIRDFLLDKTWG